MKIIEQLELKLEERRTSQPIDQVQRPSAMMAEATWWFAQIKKAVDSAPDFGKCQPLRQKKAIVARYRITY